MNNGSKLMSYECEIVTLLLSSQTTQVDSWSVDFSWTSQFI